MKVSCPICNSEVTDAKMFRPINPMSCPNCNTQLEFTTNTEKTAPLAMGIIIVMMLLHSLGIASDDGYKIFLIIGAIIAVMVIANSKIIAKELKNSEQNDDKTTTI